MSTNVEPFIVQTAHARVVEVVAQLHVKVDQLLFGCQTHKVYFALEDIISVIHVK